MKIYIIGLGGSGKTTLAKKLSSDHNLTHLNLDYIIYRPISGTHKRQQVNEEEYLKVINDAIKKDNWVIEGIFIFDQVLDQADQIIWMKPKLHTSLSRQWKRYLTDPVQRREHTMKSNFKLSKDTIKLHYGKTGRAIKGGLHLYSNREIKELLKSYQTKVAIKIS